MFGDRDWGDLDEVASDLVSLAICALDRGSAVYQLGYPFMPGIRSSPLGIKLVLDALQSFPVQAQQGLLDHTCVLFELDTKVLGVESAF